MLLLQGFFAYFVFVIGLAVSRNFSVAICQIFVQWFYAVKLKYEMGNFGRNGADWAISGRKGPKWATFGRNGHD